MIILGIAVTIDIRDVKVVYISDYGFENCSFYSLE